VPITAAISGSIYYARKKLPDHLYAGPRSPLLLAGIVGVGSLILSGLLTFGTCLDRNRPFLLELYKKVRILVNFSNLVF
jgi:hypothetical protein